MESLTISLAGSLLVPRNSGALWWPEKRTLVVADMHLGKSARLARNGLNLLPPFETRDTLERLAAEIAVLAPQTVVCLGDSFDDIEAAEDVADEVGEALNPLAAGRTWVWIAGNHDPGPVDLPGTHLAELRSGALVFRHIAERDAAPGEVSGHYHPKARLSVRGRSISRRCMLADSRRVILPAFGTYTGGLDARDKAFDALLEPDACAVLIGETVRSLPRSRLAA